MNKANEVRREVMLSIEPEMDSLMAQYLKPIETIWQPSDLLPPTNSPDFQRELKDLQEAAWEMDYDLFAVLIGDTVTEEALPTYESWLMSVQGVNQLEKNGWSRWVRAWTAEENRHGEILNRYLYLSGRVNMRELEITTHYLINDGFDIQTGTDPYRNFVYTSFQELATNISHRRVASLVKKSGNQVLAKICGSVAADEARHASAYAHFIKKIFEVDPSEMMLAFEDMMKKKIVMPAHYLRESGGAISSAYAHFSDAAQRLGVYTAQDYVDILKDLIVGWNIEGLRGLDEAAEKARDYVLHLPARLERVADRMKVPEDQFRFKWILT